MPYSYVDSIKKFAKYDNLQKLILAHIASRVPDSDLQEARQIFQTIDSDCDGQISEIELLNALPKFQKPKFFAENLASALDSNKDGLIDYTGTSYRA